MDTLRISTAALPEPHRLEAFRELFGKTILKIEIEPTSRPGFSADMRLQALPGLGIGAGALSAMQNRRPASLVDDDGLVLVMLAAGTATARQFGREQTISAGEAIMTANDAPATFVGHTPTKLINLRFDRRKLDLLDADGSALRPMSPSNPALRLLAAYVNLVGLGVSSLQSDVARSVADHVYDLAALAIGATRDGTDLARLRGVRAARLAVALKIIRSHFDEPDLTPASVAEQAGISTRYLHKLLQETGSSFSERVQELRLSRAFALLSARGRMPLRINEAAYAAGFNDLSHFNRVFRRKYGLTPTAARGSGGSRID